MFKENYNVIGVMSGTSLDGVDLAYIKFNNSGRWTFEFINPKPFLIRRMINKLKMRFILKVRIRRIECHLYKTFSFDNF